MAKPPKKEVTTANLKPVPAPPDKPGVPVGSPDMLSNEQKADIDAANGREPEPVPPEPEVAVAPPERDLDPRDPPPPPTAPVQREMVTIGRATVAKADCLYVQMADSGSIAGYRFKRDERLWVPKDALSGLSGKYEVVQPQP
jgi:hypothetical protein